MSKVYFGVDKYDFGWSTHVWRVGKWKLRATLRELYSRGYCRHSIYVSRLDDRKAVPRG